MIVNTVRNINILFLQNFRRRGWKGRNLSYGLTKSLRFCISDFDLWSLFSTRKKISI